MGLVAEELTRHSFDTNIVFDTPRSPNQVEIFWNAMLVRGIPPEEIHGIVLTLSDVECLTRLNTRREQESRSDDMATETVGDRLQVYRRIEGQVINALKRHSVFQTLPANGSREEIAALILTAITLGHEQLSHHTTFFDALEAMLEFAKPVL